jgi:ABC-2 type transport system permease protein
MMALMRALQVELAVLLRWRVAWCLCLAVPAMMVVAQLSSVITLQFNPPDLANGPGGSGTSPLTLNSTVFQLTGYTAVVAMAVGAVVVAADWERRTVVSGRLAGSGRVPLALARTVGVWSILALSAFLSFVAAGVVCALSGVFWPHWFVAGQRSLPPFGVLVHGVEVLVLTNIAYGSMGLAAGALTRRVGPAVVLCVVYALGINQVLFDLGTDVSGAFAFLYQHTPDAASLTLAAGFGEPGGGGIEPITSSAIAHATLWICVLAFAALHVLLECRDGHGRGPVVRLVNLRGVLGRLPSFRSRGPLRWPSRSSSVLAAVRAELSVIRRWPGIIALAAVLPMWALINRYAVPYGSHVEKVTFVAPSQYVPWLLPRQVLDVVLTFLDPSNDPFGVAALVLIGAWLAASSWGDGRVLSLALTQRQGRTQVVIGQAVAAIVVAAGSVLATLGLAIISSELLRLPFAGDGSLPPITHLLAGAVEAVLIAAAFVTIGWAIGFLVKSVGVAMVIVLGWVVVLQPGLIENTGPLVHGALHSVYNLLPSTLALTLAYAQGTDQAAIGPGGASAPTGAPPGMTTAIWLLCCYVLISVVAVTALAARRDVRTSAE